jgi:hypothetical protein
VGSAACLDSFAPFSEAKRVGQLAHRKNAFAMVELPLPLAHAVQQTEIIQLGGFGFTLLLVATDATVVVQPEAWLLVPLEVSGEIVQDVLRLHLLCPEVNTTSLVRVSADDDPAGRADMLEPFEHKGATGQEEFLGFTHRLAGTTKKNGHIVERAQRGGARDPL